MDKYCETHKTVKIVVVEFCPVCRGAKGGTKTGKGMTKAEKVARAKKAARARWKQKP